MSASIMTNNASLTAQRNLGVSQNALNTSIQRLPKTTPLAWPLPTALPRRSGA